MKAVIFLATSILICGSASGLPPSVPEFGAREIPNPSINLSIMSIVTNGEGIEYTLQYSTAESQLGSRVKSLLTCIGKANTAMTSIGGDTITINETNGAFKGNMAGPIMVLNLGVDGVHITNGSMIVRIACFEEGPNTSSRIEDKYGAQLSNPVDFLVNSVATGPTSRLITVTAAPKGTEIRFDAEKQQKANVSSSGISRLPEAAGESSASPPQGTKAHDGYISAIAFSPDGKLLASGSVHDKTTNHVVKIWELPSGKLVTTICGHTDCVNAVTISADGSLLASGSADETVKLWTLPEMKLLNTFSNHSKYNNHNSIAISADSKLLAYIGGHGIMTFSLPAVKPLATMTDLGLPWIIALSPSGNLMASGHGDINSGLIGLWSLPDGKLLKELTGHKQSVWALTMSPDGKLLVSGGQDRTIKTWTLPEGELGKTLNAQGIVYSLSISPDGKTLAVGESGMIELWSLPVGKIQNTLTGFADRPNVESLAFSPDGNILVSGGSDGQIYLWEMNGEYNHRALLDSSLQ